MLNDSDYSLDEYILNNSTDAEYYIINNQNFTDYGFSGSGTENSPYLITDLVITTTKECGIYVSNTDKHFKIINCTISAVVICVNFELIASNTSVIVNNTISSSDYGIYLDDCGASRIENNSFVNIASSGIFMFEAVSVKINNNTFTSNDKGINLQYFSNLEITNNLIIGSHFAGISLYYGNSVLINHNEIYGGEHAIRIRGCTNNEITFNICAGGAYGLYVTESSDCNVSDNEYSNFYTSAIYIHRSPDSIINNNKAYNSGCGITCYDSRGSSLMDNECINSDYGLYLQISNNVHVMYNYCSDNDIGLIAVSSDNLQIGMNNFLYNDEGIHLIHSENGNIFLNLISHGDTGIHLINTILSTCDDNNCSYNMYGIYFEDTEFLTCENNNCSYNMYGIYFDDTEYCKLNQNSIFNNTEDGILLEKSSHNLILRNEIYNNSKYGVNILTNSNNNTIIQNRLITNYAFSNFSQAKDDGSQNWWFDQEQKLGNYWFNHTSSKPYQIDGLAESEDKYPLDEDFVRIKGVSFSLIPLMSIFLVLSVLRLFSKKNKEVKTT